MKNQQTHQSKSSEVQTKKGNGGKHFSMAGLVLGIISITFVIIWLTKYAAASSSRLSTPSEIAAQKEGQGKWTTTQIEFQRKVDAASKEAEQKEIHDNWNTAQEEFQQKVDAASKEAKQKSDSILKESEQQ